MYMTEQQALTKMCPKRSQFSATEQNCKAAGCMAWRRSEEHRRDLNSGHAWGWCSEYPEPKNFNTRNV